MLELKGDSSKFPDTKISIKRHNYISTYQQKKVTT